MENLTRLHIQHRLDHTPHFRTQKESISRFVTEHQIDIRRELDLVSFNLYRRYFD